ncbi:MFS transporter [Sodalis ligni]|uniref:DHA1 family L-arabinose/isopropyl-beta-D-thiogalactopyranoside export protein-like MFS transporter n=1 Tax=Sodalis ligni TaxID=2697027 RepID=A0A4R1N7I0_9GAMM|nr:MFS transporter [Sodalis ligni]TCL03133.1 DHA1 family L-arabinose/isopropyl-beta-D-thiogalactopyranoside export protein-like MFS transporter [Sodalis ligni]
MSRLLILMLGAFVAQTTEYLPIGLLSQIAASLDVSETRTGTLVTGYAWIAAITAIPFTLATQRISRRTLFLGLLGIISLTNGMAALTPTFPLLIMLRLITALTHGIFWSIIAAYAVRLYPDMPASRATAWVLGGISLALVAGVPTATAVGQWMGWRVSFSAYAALGGAALWLGYRFLPVAGDISASTFVRGLPRGPASLYVASLVTVLAVTTHFVGYTYVVPILTETVHLPENRHAIILMVFGVAGVVATWLSVWLALRPFILALIATFGLVSSQAALLLTGTTEWVWLAMSLWGASVAILIVGLQSWVIEMVPNQPDAASSLYVAAFNFGIGSGALVGGIMLSRNGGAAVLMTGFGLGVLALLSFLILWQIQK